MRHELTPGRHVDLGRLDPADTGKHKDEDAAKTKLARDLERIEKLQDRLYAEQRHAVLIVLQGMDAAGKDGTVKHVMSGVNPAGCDVVPFKAPTPEEAAHDFLWRIHRATPKRGHITIFNRSHYEDVLVPRAHRTLPGRVIKERYEHINAFERILVENGTLVLKFFLHVSKEEQARRLLERLDDPDKRWKFNANDLAERALWDRYVEAYEKLLTHCGTKLAPWYCIPADHKWYRNLAVASVLLKKLAELDPKLPRAALSAADRARFRRAFASSG